MTEDEIKELVRERDELREKFAELSSAWTGQRVVEALHADDPKPIPHGERALLPTKRKGGTQKLRVEGRTFYVRSGEYEDGRLGEVFVDVAKEGAALRTIMSCFAISVSIGLQYGVPLSEFTSAFKGVHFEPNGPLDGHPEITRCTSMIAAIFQYLDLSYSQPS